jgi:hypothetical protein
MNIKRFTSPSASLASQDIIDIIIINKQLSFTLKLKIMTTKKRFYIYASWEDAFKLLSADEAKTLMMNFFRYHRGEELILDTPMLQLQWANMKFLLEKDNTAYNSKVEGGKNGAAIRELNRIQPHPTVTQNAVPPTTAKTEQKLSTLAVPPPTVIENEGIKPNEKWMLGKGGLKYKVS